MSPTNAIQEIVHDIPVTDIRPIKDALTLEKEGVLVRELHTKMQHDDFASPAAVQNPYLPGVQEMLQKELGTGNVAILEYLVREPTHGGLIRCLPKGRRLIQQTDFSPTGARDIIVNRYGPVMAEQLLHYHYKIVKCSTTPNLPLSPVLLC